MADYGQIEMEKLFYNLRLIRRQYRLSKWGMASLLGVSVRDVERIEAGEILPELPLAALLRVSGKLGIFPSSLLRRKRRDICHDLASPEEKGGDTP